MNGNLRVVEPSSLPAIVPDEVGGIVAIIPQLQSRRYIVLRKR